MAEEMIPEVEISLGYTRNAGNFESLRVDVGTRRSKLADEEDAQEARDNLYEELSNDLVARLKELTYELAEVDAEFKREFSKR